MKIEVKDIIVGFLIGLIISNLIGAAYIVYSRIDLRKQLNETEFDLRKSNVYLSTIIGNEEKEADLDDLNLYKILEETGKIKYKLKVADKTYELQSITDKVANSYVISINKINDSRRKELSAITANFNPRLVNTMIFAGMLGFIAGTFMSVKNLL